MPFQPLQLSYQDPHQSHELIVGILYRSKPEMATLRWCMASKSVTIVSPFELVHFSRGVAFQNKIVSTNQRRSARFHAERLMLSQHFEFSFVTHIPYTTYRSPSENPKPKQHEINDVLAFMLHVREH